MGYKGREKMSKGEEKGRVRELEKQFRRQTVQAKAKYKEMVEEINIRECTGCMERPQHYDGQNIQT